VSRFIRKNRDGYGEQFYKKKLGRGEWFLKKNGASTVSTFLTKNRDRYSEQFYNKKTGSGRVSSFLQIQGRVE
jgi:hypothetical protein